MPRKQNLLISFKNFKLKNINIKKINVILVHIINFRNEIQNFIF